eukprot:COSAG01_NODE_1909_length_8928_cov_64.180315_8_plen_84_part_00
MVASRACIFAFSWRCSARRSSNERAVPANGRRGLLAPADIGPDAAPMPSVCRCPRSPLEGALTATHGGWLMFDGEMNRGTAQR